VALDDLCASNVCVEGICQDGPQGVGEICDPDDDEDEDCANGACDRDTFESGSPSVGCPSDARFFSAGITGVLGSPWDRCVALDDLRPVTYAWTVSARMTLKELLSAWMVFAKKIGEFLTHIVCLFVCLFVSLSLLLNQFTFLLLNQFVHMV
jgi:hypothetical protein